MKNKIFRTEICGIFFVIIMSVFMQNLYSLCGRGLIGVMFGSVNNSIWETTKTILLPYAVWSMIELLSLRPKFHKFVATKTITLYFLGLSYILLCLIFSLFGQLSSYLPEFIAALVCIASASYLSYRLQFSHFKVESLFAPSIFLLLLFIAIYLSFTPFPPKLYMFMDRNTGLYGIIPKNIDEGAIVLDTLYYL